MAGVGLGLGFRWQILSEAFVWACNNAFGIFGGGVSKVGECKCDLENMRFDEEILAGGTGLVSGQG